MTDKEMIDCYKAQVDDLTEALEERIQRIKKLEAEVNRLQDHNLLMARKLRKLYDDGVREFAERLKNKKFEIPVDANDVGYLLGADTINAIVKEMTEDTDNGAK